MTKNRGRVREAEYELGAAIESRWQVEAQTRSKIAATHFRMDNARRLIELYERHLIPQTERAMEIAEIRQPESDL